MEIKEQIPANGDVIDVGHISFTIESADNRRVKRVKLKINPIEEENEEA